MALGNAINSWGNRQGLSVINSTYLTQRWSCRTQDHAAKERFLNLLTDTVKILLKL